MAKFSLSVSDQQHTLKLHFQEREILKTHSSGGIGTPTQAQHLRA